MRIDIEIPEHIAQHAQASLEHLRSAKGALSAYGKPTPQGKFKNYGTEQVINKIDTLMSGVDNALAWRTPVPLDVLGQIVPNAGHVNVRAALTHALVELVTFNVLLTTWLDQQGTEAKAAAN